MPCWTEQECDDYRREHDVEFQSDSEFEKADQGRRRRHGGPADAAEAGPRKVRRIELHEVKT